MKSASAIYENEEERRATLAPLLRDILAVNIQTILNKDKTNPDGVVEMAVALPFLIFLEEDKNELGVVARTHRHKLACPLPVVGLRTRYAQFFIAL
jgi:hypothetical protein